MKLINSIGIVALGFLLSIPVILLNSHVFLSLANLYDVPFAKDLTQYQVIGSLYLLSLLRSSIKKDQNAEEKSSEDMLKENVLLIITRVIEVLVLWGIATLFFNIVIK
jgi:hypothetical protein